jgi:predicted nucleotide-binding protein (sugar kinase/HSP70/actin superfamily)
LKKALVAAGYEDLPVVTLSTRLKSFNPQPDFKFNIVDYLYKALLGMVYSDGLSALYHATAVREHHKGDADALATKYMQPFENGSMPLTRSTVIQKLRQAVAEFNSLSVDHERRPKVGIVGEIYVKYNTFVNNNLVQWLMDQQVEVILPPLLSFFTGSFVGLKAGVSERIRRPDLLYYIAALGKKLVHSVIAEADAVSRDFRFYHPHKDDDETARTAQSIVQLTHQYGEGWLLSGEIGEYVKAGVQNIICLQPFGCIANHVIAKGVAKRIQNLYQDLNLLYLDLDAGISEVNYFNRLHFFLEQARTSI